MQVSVSTSERALCSLWGQELQLFPPKQFAMPPKVKAPKQVENTQLGPQAREGEEVFGVAHIYASFNDTFVVSWWYLHAYFAWPMEGGPRWYQTFFPVFPLISVVCAKLNTTWLVLFSWMVTSTPIFSAQLCIYCMLSTKRWGSNLRSFLKGDYDLLETTFRWISLSTFIHLAIRLLHQTAQTYA